MRAPIAAACLGSAGMSALPGAGPIPGRRLSLMSLTLLARPDGDASERREPGGEHQGGPVDDDPGLALIGAHESAGYTPPEPAHRKPQPPRRLEPYVGQRQGCERDIA